MLNCVIPLDIVFSLNGRINKIFPNCPPCEGECNKKYTGAGDTVIEFPAGTTDGWKEGDIIMFN